MFSTESGRWRAVRTILFAQPLLLVDFGNGEVYSRQVPAPGSTLFPSPRNRNMKVITQKQIRLAIEHAAALLKKDGANQTLTVQEWLDAAEFHPAQFPTALPALEILGLLGFGDELVRAKELG